MTGLIDCFIVLCLTCDVYMCVYVCARMRVCVCVSVCLSVCAPARAFMHMCVEEEGGGGGGGRVQILYWSLSCK